VPSQDYIWASARLVEGAPQGPIRKRSNGNAGTIGHVAGTRAKVGLVMRRTELDHMLSDVGFVLVGRTGFEPATSSVSGMAIPSDTVGQHRVTAARRGVLSWHVVLRLAMPGAVVT
jgi:hypothetical protein